MVGPVEVPAALAAETVAREGEAGRAWVASLPALVAQACERWSLVVDGPPRHGLVSLVLPVRRRVAGSRAVLKVGWPHVEAVHEAAAIAAWDGAGAVRLLDRDAESWSLLLEALDPERTLETGVPVDEAVAVAGELAGRLAAAPLPVPPGVPTLTDLAARWAEELPEQWAAAGEPLPRAQLDAAVTTCRELGSGALDVPGAGLLHGDLHFANVLAGEREPWLAIDPKPVHGDAAWDAVCVLWNRWAEVEASTTPSRAVARRLDLWCAASGADRDRARRWAQTRAVDEVLDQAVNGRRASPAAYALSDLLAP